VDSVFGLGGGHHHRGRDSIVIGSRARSWSTSFVQDFRQIDIVDFTLVSRGHRNSAAPPHHLEDEGEMEGFAVTLSLKMPMSYAHDEYLGRPSCPRCGVLILTPETSAYAGDNQIRHGWSCVDCDYDFRTIIELSDPDGCA
jgi:hypothetical protein